MLRILWGWTLKARNIYFPDFSKGPTIMMWQQLTEQAATSLTIKMQMTNIAGASVVHGQIAKVGVDA
jgi:hypothetical protein